ncbi:hypothetical protein F4775DRAFT_593552 [Biscogniauxia sp. FL1348]|nr:hypothetical protein F4775DRAFT_593552 [Biscogniauxia sp. FL1348]
MLGLIQFPMGLGAESSTGLVVLVFVKKISKLNLHKIKTVRTRRLGLILGLLGGAPAYRTCDDRGSRSIDTMQFSPLTPILALFSLAAFAAAAPGDTLAARQFYNGPCEVSNCGADGRVCSPGYVCVRWPSITEPQGCTCSTG